VGLCNYKSIINHLIAGSCQQVFYEIHKPGNTLIISEIVTSLTDE